VHGTSRDAALARLGGLVALGICDKVALHSMSPADFQSVAQVIEGVAPDEISLGPVLGFVIFHSARRDIDRHRARHAQYARRLGEEYVFTTPVLPSVLAIPEHARRMSRPRSGRRALMA